MNVLVWLKRDLRVHDHPALTLAVGIGPVLPVYVVEPELWSEPDASARQWEFVAESLAGLREEMAGVGAPLVVRVGDAVQVLAGLCKRHGIARIVSHAEVGTAWAAARNLRVVGWAQAAGIAWTEVAQTEADAAGMPPQGARLPPALPLPEVQAVAGVEPGLIPTARALRLAPDPCPHRQLGGRARGLELLDRFLAQRGEAYCTTLASPLVAERASSRLSPHLAHGTLSPHEVRLATAARVSERPGGHWRGSLSRFQASLAARQEAVQAQQPEGGEPWPMAPSRETDATRLVAWTQGETGLPFLDACLRYLRATGWLPAPLRAMVASVACWHLALDRDVVGAHLARSFTDYDPALHWPQLRAVAMGPPPRPANPVQLGFDLDPSGAFTRRWLPELVPVPDAVLHEPWRWPEARHLLGHRYPEPVVDFASATRDARTRLRQAQLSAGFAETPGGFTQRSTSRTGARQRDSAQLCLPF